MYNRREFDDVCIRLRESLLRRGHDVRLLQRIRNLFRARSRFDQRSRSFKILNQALQNGMSYLPNLLDERVGERNVVTGSFGNEFKLPRIDHKEIMEGLSYDFKDASRCYKRGLIILGNGLSRLRNMLVNWILAWTSSQGYNEVWLPIFVSSRMLLNTGQLPKFKDSLFMLTDGWYLSPTAEVQLGNLSVDKPTMISSLTRCYRDEVSYGRFGKGIVRNLEFEKNELFHYLRPERNDEEFEYLLRTVRNALLKLKLSFREEILSEKETSFSASITVDFLVWMPRSMMYLEVSSVSQCLDFQSRRRSLRFKEAGNRYFPFTINGSCLPIGRMIAVLSEYYYDDEHGDLKWEVLESILTG